MKPISSLRLNKYHFGLSYPIPIEFKNDLVSIGVPKHGSLPNKTTYLQQHHNACPTKKVEDIITHTFHWLMHLNSNNIIVFLFMFNL